MSRQAQNMLTVVLATVVGAMAVVAVILVLSGPDDRSTAAMDPLADGVSQVGSVEAGSSSAFPSSSTTRPNLAVLVDPSTALSSSSTALAVTTSATTVPVTTSTTAPTTSSGPASSAGSTTSDTASSGPSSSPADLTSTSTETTLPNPSQTTTIDGGSTTSTAPSPSTTIDATTSTTSASTTGPPPGGSLSAVEREIARLTNQLRTDPNGPLKRRGPVIDCGGRIGVDRSNDRYEPIKAVSVHEPASLQVSRPWSVKMSRSNFNHQPNAGVSALQAAGIDVRSAGENIAYHNYPDKALNHFIGWRESDGHFCNMMDPGFTHLGIGEDTKSDGISYATQNFFSVR